MIYGAGSPHSLVKSIQMKPRMTFIKSNRCLETISLISKEGMGVWTGCTRARLLIGDNIAK